MFMFLVIRIWREQPDGTKLPDYHPYLVPSSETESFAQLQLSYGFEVVHVQAFLLSGELTELLEAIMNVETSHCSRATATMWRTILAKCYWAGSALQFSAVAAGPAIGMQLQHACTGKKIGFTHTEVISISAVLIFENMYSCRTKIDQILQAAVDQGCECPVHMNADVV